LLLKGLKLNFAERTDLLEIVHALHNTIPTPFPSLWQPTRIEAAWPEGSPAQVQCDEDAAALRVAERGVDHSRCLLAILEAAAGHFAAAGQVTNAPTVRV
jgi:hypothetical protein